MAGFPVLRRLAVEAFFIASPAFRPGQSKTSGRIAQSTFGTSAVAPPDECCRRTLTDDVAGRENSGRVGQENGGDLIRKGSLSENSSFAPFERAKRE